MATSAEPLTIDEALADAALCCRYCGDNEFYASTEETVVVLKGRGQGYARLDHGACEWTCRGCGYPCQRGSVVDKEADRLEATAHTHREKLAKVKAEIEGLRRETKVQTWFYWRTVRNRCDWLLDIASLDNEGSGEGE